MYFDFSAVLVFAGVAVLFVLGTLTVGRWLRPTRPTPGKRAPYECGEEAIGSPRVRFQARFFVVALIFLIFDVEVVVLYPWVTVGRGGGGGLLSLLEVLLFLGILGVGFVYVWGKGDLGWLRAPRPTGDSRDPGVRG